MSPNAVITLAAVLVTAYAALALSILTSVIVNNVNSMLEAGQADFGNVFWIFATAFLLSLVPSVLTAKVK